MATLKSVARALCPHILIQWNETRKNLSATSRSGWLNATSSKNRIAYHSSRFAILPPCFTRSPGFVIDVGANEGQWISSLSRLVSIPETWIFEPNPEAMKLCHQRLGDDKRIRYFDVALGDTCGELELHVTGSSVFSSVLEPRADFLRSNYEVEAALIVKSIPVEANTLDNLVPEEKTVSLLKIDVQGFERAVLAGARRVLARTQTVLIETNLQSHYCGDDNLPALWNEMVNRGFSFWNISPPYCGPEGGALWADAVFVNTAVCPNTAVATA